MGLSNPWADSIDIIALHPEKNASDDSNGNY